MSSAGGLQRGSENYAARMGSLGPWTPPNLATLSDMGGSAALHPLMSLNNLLKLGRCGELVSGVDTCLAEALDATLKMSDHDWMRPFCLLSSSAHCQDFKRCSASAMSLSSCSVGSLGSLPPLSEWERQGVPFPSSGAGPSGGAEGQGVYLAMAIQSHVYVIG